jgi:UPF0271 protein
VLLNIDAGELESESEELWSLADILNVACGGHAGDAESMNKLVVFCTHASKLGAHPSYPDRKNFGRVSIAIDADSLARSIETQCRALAEIARARGVTVEYVKPHGALYHDARTNDAIAEAVLHGATNALGAVAIIGPPTGALRERSDARGLRFLREGFADRRARADGTLVPRTEPNALVTDPNEAAAIAKRLDADTVCVHGDTPDSIRIARAVREIL